MKHLKIYNFGPIREVDLNFKRVNVIIGPQNAGKSCVLKIACHCAWVEKRLMVTKDVQFFQKEDFFFKQLLEFHNLKGYDTSPKLRIVYDTSFMKLEYDRSREERFSCKFKNSQAKRYKRAKLSYIPAERNVISTVPNWADLQYKEGTMHSFMSDWMESRKEFVYKRFPILSMGAEYYYDETKNNDYVKFSSMENPLPMSNVSSGMQSLIPILIYIHYLTHSVFNDKSVSATRKGENTKLKNRMYGQILLEEKKKAKKENVRENKPFSLSLNSDILYFSSKEGRDAFEVQYRNYTEYQHSDIYLEEPEENLFPETQAEVLDHLLSKVFSTSRENSLFVATHSHYILYALNNAIMANIVRDKMPKEYFERIKGLKNKFDPKDVSIWQIEDGELKTCVDGQHETIQDRSGLLLQNYFDDEMGRVMKDFTNMLNYL